MQDQTDNSQVNNHDSLVSIISALHQQNKSLKHQATTYFDVSLSRRQLQLWQMTVSV